MICTECKAEILEQREQRCPWCQEPMCRICWCDRYAGQCSKCEAEHGSPRDVRVAAVSHAFDDGLD